MLKENRTGGILGIAGLLIVLIIVLRIYLKSKINYKQEEKQYGN